MVGRAAGLDRQAGRGNVDAQHHGAGAQALHRQRIVDLGGGRVVDRKGARRRQRQLVLDRGRLEFRKARALGKVLQQEAFPVELVGRVDGAGPDQQVQRPQVGGARGLDHGLVLGCVLVGLEQDLVELVADGLRAHALAQFLDPGLDLQRDLLLFLDGGQRLRQDVG